MVGRERGRVTEGERERREAGRGRRRGRGRERENVEHTSIEEKNIAR